MRYAALVVALLVSASPAVAQVRVTGAVPDGVSEEYIQQVWQFVRTLTGITSKEAPMLYFAPFTRPPDDPAWAARLSDWHQKHPGTPNPLPRHSLGWFFEDTDVLQVSPVAFTRFPGTGQGYAVIAHELEHYLYDGVIPTERQHCYFESRGHRTAAIDFLVESGIASDVLRVPRVDMIPQSGCDEPSK